jgi:DNA-binding MarR family transcriptional regulator
MKTNNKNEIVEMIFKVSRLMKDEMSYKNNLIHLSILQIQTLIYLNKNKLSSMSDIANNFQIELSSATSLVNKLTDLKLVKRFEDKEDRRLVMIDLTEIGKTLLKQAMCERRKKMERILLYLSESERTDLLKILKTLNNKLKK